MIATLPRRSRRAPDGARSSLVIHNVVVAGRRTSVRLEPVMWEALNDIAQQQRTAVNALVTMIDQTRTASSLTAAIRVFIVEYYRSAATVTRTAEPPYARAV